MRTTTFYAAIGPIALASAAAAQAPVLFTPAASPSPRYGAACAFDPVRGELLMFGGKEPGGISRELWQWNGQRCLVRAACDLPEERERSAAVFDPVRGRWVMFGGENANGYFADTWEFNGTTWRRVPTATSPPARAGHALAFDYATNEVLLFGGQTGPFSITGDTWTFDGTRWLQRSPAQSPSARRDHDMAGTLGVAGGRVLLFGGVDAGGRDDETWEWNGSSWIQQAPTRQPTAREGLRMEFMAATGQVVLFGGNDGSQRDDTWVWSGGNWTEQTPSSSLPGGRWAHAMGYDALRNRVVVFGGRGPFGAAIDDLWEWDGTAWAQRVLRPDGRFGAAMAYDAARQRSVMFGGNGRASETWEWDGAAWIARTPTRSPAGRDGHVMVADSRGGGVVVFGGTGPVDDTWRYDGVNWTQLAPAQSPPARTQATACALGDGRILVFGGRGGFGVRSDDTWVFDGATNTWTQVATGGPSARFGAAMAFDAASNRVLLFGGDDGGLAGDTWAFDVAQSSWSQLTPLTNPSPRSGHAMIFDASRNRVVLHGGETGFFAYSDEVWEWTGVDWRRTSSDAAPEARTRHALAFDAQHSEWVVFGGNAGSTTFDDTHVAIAPVAARAQSFGVGCPGSGTVPVLAAAGGSAPWIGGVFSFEVTGAAPSGVVLAVLGFSRTQWPGGTLPASLVPYGLPGCTLLVSPSDTLFGLSIAGTARFSLTLPACLREFEGLPFYVQAFVTDAQAPNAARGKVTNGLDCALGIR